MGSLFLKRSFLSPALHSTKRPLAKVSRLALKSFVTAVGLGVLAWAAPAQAGGYSTTISPTTSFTSQSKVYTLVANNVSPISGDVMGSARWTIPTGFTVTNIGTVTASASKSWSATQVGSQVRLVSSNNTNRINNGQQVSVVLTMTAPATTGARTFSISCKSNRDHTGGEFLNLNLGNDPTVTVSIAPNTAPVANDDPSYTTDEDTLLTGTSVLANDTDGESNPLTANLVTGPANASSFTLNSDGTFSYTPSANFHGTDSFTYQANDGSLNSGTATATITVAPIADAPTATDDPGYTTDEDVAITAASSVLANDGDVDGDSLTAVLDATTTNGVLVLNADGTFDYTPGADFNGTDTFTYHANDGGLDSNVVTVTITVAPIADAPVAVEDPGYTTDEDVVLNATSVLDNDTDGDGDTLTAVLDTDVSNGTLVLDTDGTFDYTPDADFNGTDSFTYHANDGGLDSNIVTVTITVAPIADAPVAVDDPSYTTDEDVVLNGTSVLDNDTDADADTLTAVLDTDVSNGTLVLDADGTFDYTPAADFNGTDSFTYHANDGGLDSNIVTVTITVAPINDAPVAVADPGYTTDEDVVLNGTTVLDNDSDTENDGLTAVLDDDVTNGTLVLNNDGTFTYTPDANFNGTDTFTYHANDSSDDSNVVTVTITVAAVNDAPTTVNNTYTGVQDTTLTVPAPGVLGNDTDVEASSLTAVIDVTTANGALTLNADGSFSYVPNTGFYGADTFTYHANDGGLDGNVATVTINVQRTYWIFGLVRYGNVTPAPGVTVTRTGGVSVVTDAGGNFTFTGLLPGTYTITPSATRHTFVPPSSNITITTGSRALNFNATRQNQITGRVITTASIGIAGVTVSRGGGNTAVTNGAGYYTFSNVPNGNYTLTATLSGNTFTPSTRAVTIANNDGVNQNFMSGFTINGRVATSGGIGIANVTVSTNTGLSGLTNGAGYYTIHNAQPGTYTVSASLSGNQFMPPSQSVTVTNANVNNINYTKSAGP